MTSIIWEYDCKPSPSLCIFSEVVDKWISLGSCQSALPFLLCIPHVSFPSDWLSLELENMENGNLGNRKRLEWMHIILFLMNLFEPETIYNANTQYWYLRWSLARWHPALISSQNNCEWFYFLTPYNYY